MTGTNHGITGAVIALAVKEPVAAVPLSYASHFACDAMPHFGLKKNELFNRKFNIILVTDFIVAVILMGILGALFPAQRWVIWASMIAAASPDLMWAYYNLYLEKIKGLTPKLDPLAHFHSFIQWSQTPKGLLMEGGWFLVMGLIILSQR